VMMTTNNVLYCIACLNSVLRLGGGGQLIRRFAVWRWVRQHELLLDGNHYLDNEGTTSPAFSSSRLCYGRSERPLAS
jgi:hypothetical protein